MNMVAFFSEPWAQRLGWVLIHFLWQGMGVALLLAIALSLLSRASSHVRYVVIAGALLLCGALPVATWILLAPQAPPFVSPETTLPLATDAQAAPPAPADLHPDAIMERPVEVQERWQARLARLANVALPGVVGFWLTGVLILALRLTLVWMWMRRLCLSGLPVQDTPCLERFRGLRERMHIDVPVRLLQSALVEVPTLIGWLRPTILVPASVFIGLTPGQLDAILAHELAHVRRYDYLVNLFQTAIETILFYHPVIWWISCELREERENCCDDIALDVTEDRFVYASALARLEEDRGLPLALTASGGSLLQRIRRIVGANDRKVSAWPLWALIIGVLSMACLTKSKATEPAAVASPSTTTTEKLKSIVLPELSFDHADIRAVLQVLAAKSKDLDPDKKGVHFALRLGFGADSQGAGPLIDLRIHPNFTLRATDISLLHVLDLVASQTGLIYQIEPEQVYLRPPLEENSKSLAIRSYFAPPNFITGSYPVAPTASSSGVSSSAAPRQIDVKEELKTRGILFPDGASVTFFPESNLTYMGGKLVMTNTPDQLDEMSILVDHMSRDVRQSVESRVDVPDAPTVAGAPQASDSTSTSLSALDVKVTISLSGKLRDWSKQSNGWGGGPVTHIDLVPAGLKFGHQGVIEEVREFPYPTEFDEPKSDVSATFQGKPVTLAIPMFPREFVTKNVGWSISVTPEKGENGIVHLTGTATCTTATLSHGAYGEKSGAIYKDFKNPQTGTVNHVLISKDESSMPIFQTSVTPFFVFAKPGQPYHVNLQSGSDSIDATIRCDLLEKSPSPLSTKTTDASKPASINDRTMGKSDSDATPENMSETEAKRKGMAALVNGKPIFWSDIASDLVLSKLYREAKDSGDKLSLQFMVQEAIDRELVIQAAEVSGYRVPQSDLDERVNYGVKGFGGNKDAFAENLKENGSSLEEFTEQNRRSEIDYQMLRLHVYDPTETYLHEHPPALPAGASPEATKKAENALFQKVSIKLENDWMAGLRSKAVIQTFADLITTSPFGLPTTTDSGANPSQTTQSTRTTSVDESLFYQSLERDHDLVADSSVTSSTLAADAQMLLAIQMGDVPALKKVLEHAVDPNTFDPDRFNSCPVYWAVHFDHPEILKLLLEHFAKGDIGPAHETPLQLAQSTHSDLVPMIEEGNKRNRALLTSQLTAKLHSIRIDLPAFSGDPLSKVTLFLLDATSKAGYLQRRVAIGNMDLPPATTITSPPRLNISIWDALQTIADANKLKFAVDDEDVGSITFYPPRDENIMQPPTKADPRSQAPALPR
jgi:beta-lactamase regulating signal transducer with metallopeptidase domain